MSERFYANPITVNEPVRLVDAEARHLSRVMRMVPGDQITIFDGMGNESTGTIQSIRKNEVLVQPGEIQAISREPSVSVKLGVALPKGDRLKFMVEKITEIGVSHLYPLSFARSSVKPGKGNVEKMRRYVIEASKQCGRNTLLAVHEAMSFTEFIELPPENSQKLVCTPGSKRQIDHVYSEQPDSVWFLIGPEGGITDEEAKSAIASGWHPATLGKRILRTETAAIVCATIATTSVCR